jgi:hypothetical protein
MGSGGDGGNLKNAIVAFLAPLPSILFYLSLTVLLLLGVREIRFLFLRFGHGFANYVS